MGKYILKRILIAIPVLIGITLIDYAIMCLAGSPLEMLKGPRISDAALQAKEIAAGLDKPLIVQYFVWLWQLLQGNLGYSMKSYEPVSAMIGSHIGPTLLLMGASLALSLLIAVPAGIYSAVKQYSKGDYAVVTASFIGSSIPSFFLALILIYIFTVKLGILPSGGMNTLGMDGSVADTMTAYGSACYCACSFFSPEATSVISEALFWRFYSRIICGRPGQKESAISG